MQTALDCLPCLVRQAVEMARRMAPAEPARQCELAAATLAVLSTADLRVPPPSLAGRIQARMASLTGIADPYADTKRWSNELAERLLREHLGDGAAEAGVSFETACRYAIAGNVIDFGVRDDIDEAHVRAGLEAALSMPVDTDAVAGFQRAVDSAGSILYLADNAGEIVFDRVLLRQLPLDRVVVAVKGGPVINDATMADAEAAGLTGMTRVMDTGSALPGTVLETCTEAFCRRFHDADLIIAKGQGNYETLNEVSGRFVFLLKVKCGQVAAATGRPVGTHIVDLRDNRP
jgi:uncharacterized protein with ATP-grasp and redox domains